MVLDEIIANAIGGLIAALMLEALRALLQSRRTGPSQPYGSDISKETRNRNTGIRGVLRRTTYALIGGFFGSAFLAACVEIAITPRPDIQFGDPISIVFMIFATAFTWMIFSLASYRKSKNSSLS